jgi:uncharacterized protein YjdB
LQEAQWAERRKGIGKGKGVAMKKHPVSQCLTGGLTWGLTRAALIFALAFAPAGLFVSCGGGGDSGRVVNVTGVTLNEIALDLGVNEQKTLVATIMPSNATNQRVVWLSDDTNIASVTNGRVRGVGVGDAIIAAMTENGGFEVRCDVFVRVIPVLGVSLDKTSIALVVGNVDTLTPIFQPANASNKNVSWSSSNPGAARIEGDGVVRAMAPGYATITATTQDGNRIAACAVAVLSEDEAVRVTGVSLSSASMTLGVGGSGTLTATVQPSTATNKSVSWSSSNPSVASASGSGPAAVVSASEAGTATITVATSDGGKVATCAITVVTAVVPVTGVTLNKTSLTLNVGGSDTLVADVQPGNATNKTVAWASSNAGVASVSNGLVAAMAPGDAAITVTTSDGGKTATCSVTVPTPPADVYVAGYVGSYYPDRRATLWKNGAAQTLSSATSEASAVFVSGGDVYVAGHVGYFSDGRATLWKNGAAQTLSSNYSQASAVFVSGNDVYVAGHAYPSGSMRATLWKNGAEQTLSGNYSQADAVFVSDGDVYVAGYTGAMGSMYDRPTLWKNGWAEELPWLADGYAGRALSVHVSGADVYVAGNASANGCQKAVLWKNGAIQSLGSAGASHLNDDCAHSVHVSGGDAYVAGIGKDGGDRATLWKNGAAQNIGNSGTEAYSVYVYGNDVYVAWRQGSGAALWKNGQSLTLANSGAARSVFVK